MSIEFGGPPVDPPFVSSNRAARCSYTECLLKVHQAVGGGGALPVQTADIESGPSGFEIPAGQFSNYGPLGVDGKRSRYPAQVFRSQLHPSWETKMTQLLDRILGDPNLGLSATARIILLHLAQSPAGSRIEDIARLTGSKYRWVENHVSKLTRAGILRRVAPNTYAINSDRDREGQK
jgi:hypothetical protein